MDLFLWWLQTEKLGKKRLGCVCETKYNLSRFLWQNDASQGVTTIF